MALYIKSSPELALRDLWMGVLRRMIEPVPLPPRWPPDAFALCCHALKSAAAYVQVLANWPPESIPGESWRTQYRDTGRQWRAATVAPELPLPAAVQNCWKTILDGIDRPLSALREPGSALARSLLELMAYADEACSQLLDPSDRTSESYSFASLARIEFEKHRRQSVCREIDESRLRVLPKSRVTQRGLTIRSLSLFLCLIEGTEVETTFSDNRQIDKGLLTVNVLLLPWPFSVRPSQFSSSKRLRGEMRTMSDEFGFFTYRSRPLASDFVPALRSLLNETRDDCGPASIVVLPELAVSDSEAAEIRELLADEFDCMLVMGVGTASVPGERRGVNRVQLYTPGVLPIEQDKHHRWKLDRNQVVQYSLGNSLHHETAWWEHVDISARRLSFVRLSPWLTVCSLICEDLARPDPAGDAIRAVGPNLVIALLMDGPQLASRWASRHATTLAEDPGSSVLTLTSLGMSELSRPVSGPTRERVIALWKEEGGSAVEIELPRDRRAAVLSISMKACTDWGADGRVRESSIPSLTGVRFLKADNFGPLV